MDHDLYDSAQRLLGRLTNRPDARFHDGQWEAIRALVADRRRVLVVQRTGWGKSAVYFIATRLLRDQGTGPTVLVSPLLALMRNQIEAANRMGVVARTINSANESDWGEVLDDLRADRVDLLLISPERLANDQFRRNVLTSLGPRAGLVVIDEAHCISDWGHDFRPDYRRIRGIIDVLPRTVPILACTATANDRVVGDITVQLGEGLLVERGPLARAGLALQVIDLPSPAQRMAWLAEVVPTLEGTGIVYCLTKRDAEVVTSWLEANGIDAACYTGDSLGREEVEQRLLANDVKVVVATSALGMGFDKPDVGFVIHYQSPGSPIAYYQQVGRAGRLLDRSVGVLLRGHEDRDIQDWFISRAFPTRAEAEAVVGELERSEGLTKQSALLQAVNIRPSRIDLLLKNLEVDGALVAEGRSYRRTPQPWRYDDERVAGITALRREEQRQMLAYASDGIECRMAFLQHLLDDPSAGRCGLCDRCTGSSLPRHVDPARARAATQFVRRQPITIESRKRWPDMSNLPLGQRVEQGRALARLGDGGWGELVHQGRHDDLHFADDLVAALAEVVRAWHPVPAPAWLTYVPSLRQPELVADLTTRLGTALRLPVHAVVAKVHETPPQHTMDNSAQQLDNVRGAFAVVESVPPGPVLLVDDLTSSRWTLTEIGALLRKAGCPKVFPLALADAGAS